MTIASYSAHSRDFPAARLRADFPLLQRSVRGQPLAYLDNAATTQKPQAVIDAETRYYREINANIHRGVHWLSEQATAAHEAARERVRRFLNARETAEIIFVRGTTEAINLVAQSYGRANLGPGDEVLITGLEHHSNIVPWQMVCQQTGAVLRVAHIDDTGTVRMDEFRRLLCERTRVVSVVQVSNALGTINPVQEMTHLAHQAGAVVLLDGAQAVAHTPVDVQALDCDFYAFSGHKLYAPTGIGVLYGRRALLEAMPPWQGGGDMIRTVSFEGSTWNDLPYKFEAGTPHIAGAIGLGAAIEYLSQVGLDAVAAYEHELLVYGTALLQQIPGLRMIGTAAHKAGILSFVIDGLHAHDIGTVLDTEGVAIRAGHHCAMPVMDRFGVPATARASLAFYNTREDLDRLAQALRRAVEMFVR
jgi:cysteine desulfurase/selenocysteine lyase